MEAPLKYEDFWISLKAKEKNQKCQITLVHLEAAKVYQNNLVPNDYDFCILKAQQFIDSLEFVNLQLASGISPKI